MSRGAVPLSLIVNLDDDEAARSAKSRIFEQAGYRVLEAATVRDALRLIRDAQPHLVVLDVGLPDMNGNDICRQIKADSATADTVVLQVSASVQPSDRILGLEECADMYLIEPVEPMELLAAVKALLRLSHREEEKRLLMAQLEEAHRSLSLAQSSELGVLSSGSADVSNQQNPTLNNSRLITQNLELRQRSKVRIVLADDHAMLRQGLRSVLEAYTDVEVAGEAADGEQAIALARSLQPEVVVMDVNMPGVDGIEATRLLKLEQPTIIVIGLSVHSNRAVEQAMRDAGADGFLTKEVAVEQLYHTIQTVLR